MRDEIKRIVTRTVAWIAFFGTVTVTSVVVGNFALSQAQSTDQPVPDSLKTT